MADTDTAGHLPPRQRSAAVTAAEHAADLESSVELLRTIAAVLDIRSVFPQVSEIAAKVVPHDLLTMTFDDDHGQVLIEAASTDALTGLSRIRRVDDSEPEEGFVLIDDLATADLFVVEPHDFRERFLAAGFRSGLIVMTRARYQGVGLGFWSQRPSGGAADRPCSAIRMLLPRSSAVRLKSAV